MINDKKELINVIYLAAYVRKAPSRQSIIAHRRLVEVSEQTGLSVSGVKKAIAALKAAGLLVHRGTNKRGLWLVSPMAVRPPKSSPIVANK